MSSTNAGRLNVVRNTLLACRTNDPDEAATYIELIEKIDELMNYQGEVKRVDQWVDEIKDYKMQAEGQDRHAERFAKPFGADDLFKSLFPQADF